MTVGNQPEKFGRLSRNALCATFVSNGEHQQISCTRPRGGKYVTVQQSGSCESGSNRKQLILYNLVVNYAGTIHKEIGHIESYVVVQACAEIRSLSVNFKH